MITLLLALTLTTPQHYVLVFSRDSKPPLPWKCHVWSTHVQITNNQITDQFTTSWAPKGKWSLIDKAKPGYNISLQETLNDAKGSNIRMWGPYEITQETYNDAKQWHQQLPNNAKYKALDALSRKKSPPAINCFHAITQNNLKTYAYYGKFAAKKIIKYYKKQNLLKPTDNTEFLQQLGLNEITIIHEK